MKTENLKKILAAGMVSCLLTGCGNVIPELTEEEASLIATYAADVTLSHSRESDASRLIDTEAETARLEELAEKIESGYLKNIFMEIRYVFYLARRNVNWLVDA